MRRQRAARAGQADACYSAEAAGLRGASLVGWEQYVVVIAAVGFGGFVACG
jgi:hypothetical protein